MYTDPLGYFAGLLVFSPGLVQILGGMLASLGPALVAAAPYIVAALVIVAVVLVVIYAIDALSATSVATQSSGLVSQSKLSDKERSTEKPSWVNKNMLDHSLSAQENAANILKQKYGSGGNGGKRGPGSEFNKIVKWIVRGKLLHDFFTSTNYNNNEEKIFIYDWAGWKI